MKSSSKISDAQKEALKKYVTTIRNTHNWHIALEYTMAFCEENDLCDLFVACKLRHDAFYGVARYISEDKPISDLEKIVDIINKQVDTGRSYEKKGERNEGSNMG